MSEPEPFAFTSDWFSYNIPTWRQLFATETRPAGWRVLEIGSFEGRSTVWLCQNLIRDAGGIWCIDTFEGVIEAPQAAKTTLFDRFLGNIAKLENRDRVHVLRGRSCDKLYELIAAGFRTRFDLVYVDGSHRTDDVLRDAVLSFDLLAIGGIMIFDDYLWSREPAGEQNPLSTPKLAIDAFTNCYSNKLSLFRNVPLYQMILKKTAE
jgi:predicted O-methyltransferase YrrM